MAIDLEKTPTPTFETFVRNILQNGCGEVNVSLGLMPEGTVMVIVNGSDRNEQRQFCVVDNHLFAVGD